MEQRQPYVVLGLVLHSYPPFLVRQQIVKGAVNMPDVILPDRVITMPFRGEEYRITSTYDSRDDIPWVIDALRRWLAVRPRIIRHFEAHLDTFQRPEGMARLEAALEAEREADREAEVIHRDGSSADSSRPRVHLTAEQVLANQREELERIRQLTHEVTQGLQALEAAHPEAVASLDEVADEIRRRSTRKEVLVRMRAKGEKPQGQ